MTTDITELAQRLKAVAEKAIADEGPTWFSEDQLAHDGGLALHAADAQFIALANPANILALVEALEKAQTINAAAEKLVRCKGRYHSELNYRALAALFGVTTPDLPPLEHENVHYADAAEMEIAALRQRIAELESRTVTVKLPSTIWYEHDDYAQEIAVLEKSRVLQAMTAAGIKWEAE